MEKIGLLGVAVLCVGMWFGFAHAAVTPNSIITTQAVATYNCSIGAGDHFTASETLFAASTNGDKVYKVLVYPAASDREITLLIKNGVVESAFCLTDITADASAPVIPVDVLANVPLSVDSNGNKYLELKSGDSLMIKAEDVAVTTPVIVLKQSY